MTSQKFPNITKAEYVELVDAFRKNEGQITNQGNHSFDFEIKTPLGNVEGSAGYQEPVLEIMVKKTPLFISHKKVLSELQKILLPYTRA
jgi:hypothetical protein